MTLFLIINRQPLDLKKFEQLRTIQQAYATNTNTIRVIEKATGKTFMAKIFSTNLKYLQPQVFDRLKKEVQLITSLSHPLIIKTFGYSYQDFKNKDHLVLITENTGKRSLDDIIKLEQHKRQPPKWNDTKKLINLFGIAHGMSYLHHQGIMHGNLKPSNIYETNQFYPKIADFGLFLFKEEEEAAALVLTQIQGQPFIYDAPEISKGDYYDFSSDVFSFGMIFFTLFCVKYPSDTDCC